MAEIYPDPEIRSLLVQLGYNEAIIQDIQNGLNTLFRETGFPEIKRTIFSANQKKDITQLVDSLKKLMVSMEDKGFFRPDIPQPLLKLLVNGLNLNNEDIFAILDRSGISNETKIVTIQPSLRPDIDSENPLICVYGDTFFSF